VLASLPILLLVRGLAIVGLRRTRSDRASRNGHEEQQPITFHGRPKEVRRRQIPWVRAFLRILTVAWGGAIALALIDAFGDVPYLPFLMAMGMTGMLVVAMFLFTQPLDSPEPGRSTVGEDEDTVHDLLTDLPTFAYFQRRLNDEFSRSRRMGRKVAAVLVDVNNLTAVNKEYGVKAGDEVLRHVARAVDGTRRYNDVVARLGDDEFGVILLDTGNEGVSAFVDRLEDRLARESAVAEVGGRSIALWAGICSGNAVSVPSMTTPEELLEAAMQSLNNAKQERERRRRTWLTA
jgi:diguanylate cyclase (GGDEF)-like protein